MITGIRQSRLQIQLLPMYLRRCLEAEAFGEGIRYTWSGKDVYKVLAVPSSCYVAGNAICSLLQVHPVCRSMTTSLLVEAQLAAYWQTG